MEEGGVGVSGSAIEDGGGGGVGVGVCDGGWRERGMSEMEEGGRGVQVCDRGR